MNIISDVGDPRYYESRAIEFIKDAQDFCKHNDLVEEKLKYYDDCIIKAIQLLILARETRV